MKQKKEWERLWAKSSSGYSNSSQKCSKQLLRALSSSSCLLPSILQYTTSVGGKSTRGKKRGRAILTATNARGAFFQSSSVRLGHQKKSPDWQRQRRWYYTQLEAFHLLSFMVPPPFRPMASARYVKRSHS